MAESLIEALNQRASILKQKFLLPRADKARSLLKDELIKAGADVNEIIAYRTIIESDQGDDVIHKLRSGDVDLLTFSSSSTVENFVEILGRDQLPLLKHVTVACIGPITKKTADKFALKTSIMPEEYSIPGLVQEILNYYKNHK